MADGILKILLIEDERSQAELIEEMLASGQREQYVVQHVDDLDQGLAALRRENFDCILIDLPDSQGLLRALSLRKAAKGVPVIVLAALDDEETALKALKLDIQDYLIREEMTQATLARSIRCALQRSPAAVELAQSEERLRFATAAAGIGMWHWDLVEDRLFLDAGCKKLLGFPPDSFPTCQDVSSHVHPEDRERAADALRRCVAEDEEFSQELRVLLPDGELRWIVSKGRAHYDERGNPLRADGISMDITERKRAEEELLVAKEQWERTFDGVPDLIAILNSKNKIMRVNAAMARMMGKKAEECIGTPCYAVFHGTHMPPHSCPHAKAVCESREQITEVQQFGSDNHFLVSYTPLFDAEGNFTGVVHVARDITERKQAESRIEQLNAELASRAADLEAANGELEAFNYTAAHDLRQPLNVIDGSCQLIELLCGQQLSGQCHGLLREIRGGVKRMTLLLDALLNFSRMGRVEPQRAAVDLSEIARSVAKELRDTDSGRSARFVIAEGIEVDGDPALLEIVLRNLLGNAWKYAGGQENALIEFGSHDVEGETAYFVRDNGPGFDMADAEKLFVPFQRLSGTQSIGGFGIGLATVQRVVARHGGRVWAEGVPGQGAIFRFTVH